MLEEPSHLDMAWVSSDIHWAYACHACTWSTCLRACACGSQLGWDCARKCPWTWCNPLACSVEGVCHWWTEMMMLGYKGYKDGLQPEILADGNWLVKQDQPVSKVEAKSDTNLRSLYESWFRNALISKSVILWWQAKKGINSELKGANARRVLNKTFLQKGLCISCAARTLAKEKHMLLILNFSTLTFITNARTTMPFARLHSQMVRKQSEPAEIPQHMFVQILVRVGRDRKWRTSRTTLRTPTPLVIRDCFLVYCARTWKISFPPYLQMSETQIFFSCL